MSALRRRFPGNRSAIHFDPDPETVALFGQSPGLETRMADDLGFSRDRDADALVCDAMEEDANPSCRFTQ